MKQLLFYTEMSNAQADFSSPIGGVMASEILCDFVCFEDQQLVLYGLSHKYYKLYLESEPETRIYITACCRFEMGGVASK